MSQIHAALAPSETVGAHFVAGHSATDANAQEAWPIISKYWATESYYVGHTVTKKVRLDDAYARRLSRLARKRGVSESEVLRQGLDLIEATEVREKALARLIELAEIKGPRKETYEFK